MGQLKNKETMTQEKQILELLTSGKTLTPLDALKPPLNCMRLASRISALKKEGHPIVRQMIEVGKNKRVAQYSLQKSA